MEFVSKGWIGGRGGLENRLKTEERQVIRLGWGRARLLTEEVASPAGPPLTSRDRPLVQEVLGHLTRWLRRSRTYHDAVTR